MENKQDHIRSEDNASNPNWRALPFDAATNFSLLGWIIDKFKKERKTEANIDLRLK